MKGEFIVLKRLRGGDVDLVGTLYGTAGKVTLFLKEGYLNTNRLFGIFEPFNYVEIDYSQAGNIIVPNDVMRVERFSLFALNYKQYLYMSSLSLFALQYFNYYDENLFELLLSYLIKKPRNSEVILLKFKLDFLKAYGILPKFLSQETPKTKKVKIDLSTGEIKSEGEYEIDKYIVEFLKKLLEAKNPDRLNLTRRDIKKAEDFLREYLKFHLKV